MKVQKTISVDIETAEIMDEMRNNGIIPSHFFMKAAKALKDCGFDYPVMIGEESEAE